MLILLIFLVVMGVGAIILASTPAPDPTPKPSPKPSPNILPDISPTPTPPSKPKCRPGDKPPSSITQMKTYRVAPTVDGITGKNTGDLKGDNAYISGEFCARSKDKTTGKDTCDLSKVTEYVVSYPDDFKFGQYALCNPGGKVGGTGTYKCGRCDEQCIDPNKNTSTGGFFRNQGSGGREVGSTDANKICEFQKTQCKDKSQCNTDLTRCTPNPGQEFDRFSGGNWYSWPAACQCKSLNDLKAGKCTWYVDKTTKSVDAQTLRDKGYKMMTNEEIKNGKVCTNPDKCTDKEIKAFVNQYEQDNLKVLQQAFGTTP